MRPPGNTQVVKKPHWKVLNAQQLIALWDRGDQDPGDALLRRRACAQRESSRRAWALVAQAVECIRLTAAHNGFTCGANFFAIRTAAAQ